ncbi:MAG: SWIM zinc finger family protein [Kiritimatiellae bacterium]|nr:SWIM zinc finger family protein [Kiritimatiellia bacterium]
MSKKRYPVRVPRTAAGIRAQESRTGCGRSWWAREWTRRLEAMGLKGRFGRGRSYAASGQVVALEIAGPHVTAKVQGTRQDPYAVTVDFRIPDAAAHKRILSALRAEPMHVARLLADDLPTEVGEIFAAEGYDIFPGGKLGPGRYDTTTACSCPDYANPCKHAAAVLLLLGEEIARRPLTLLEFRGIFPEDLCGED